MFQCSVPLVTSQAPPAAVCRTPHTATHHVTTQRTTEVNITLRHRQTGLYTIHVQYAT